MEYRREQDLFYTCPMSLSGKAFEDAITTATAAPLAGKMGRYF